LWARVRATSLLQTTEIDGVKLIALPEYRDRLLRIQGKVMAWRAHQLRLLTESPVNNAAEADLRGFPGAFEVSGFARWGRFGGESLRNGAVGCGRAEAVIRFGARAGALPMRPKQASPEANQELFRSQLENIVDARHPLVRLLD